jgi:predicted enzyme related to lactoylglutathione lyase
MAHPIVHVELSANSRQAAAQWYADLFGWSTQDFPDMNYSTASTGEGSPAVGFSPVSPDYPAGNVTFYIHTDDVKGHLDRIVAKGGQVLMPAQDIPGVGTIALFRDPTGNMVGLLQPVAMQTA